MAYDKQTWADGQAGATPLNAARLNHMEDGIDDAAASGSANGVTARVLATPATDTENGFVVKAPSATWGTGPYGTGQAFMLLKDGSGTVEPDDLVLWRVDEDGDMGVGGGIHVATDLRKDVGDPASTQAVWIEPSNDMVLLVLDGVAGQTKHLIDSVVDGSRKFVVTYDGSINLFEGATNNVVINANNTATFGARMILQTRTAATIGIHLALAASQTANAINVANSGGTSILSVGATGFIEMLEQADPAAPATNRARLFTRDNGAGKTQVCVRFPTGAVQVIATEP